MTGPLSVWLSAAQDWAGFWSGPMLRACWQGGLALAVVWALCRLSPRTPPRLRCWLWRLAYLKLLLALFWITPVDLPVLTGGERRATSTRYAGTRVPGGERASPIAPGARHQP